eukprot:c26513_g1_i1 orf=686-1789(-)
MEALLAYASSESGGSEDETQIGQPQHEHQNEDETQIGQPQHEHQNEDETQIGQPQHEHQDEDKTCQCNAPLHNGRLRGECCPPHSFSLSKPPGRPHAMEQISWSGRSASPLCAPASLLPPPSADLLNPSNSAIMVASADPYLGRIRSFPHVEGNYALHVYIPVPLSSITKRRLEPLIKRASVLAPELQSMNVPLYSQCLESKSFLSPQGIRLANEYHLSLSRTVPIRIHQIDSVVSMLRQKFYNQKRYWMEFVKWDAFVNDEQTRSFLALEILSTGSSQICRQISVVNEVFGLHNLPTYYENPRPHISLAWTLGIVSPSLKNAAEELNKWIETSEGSSKLPIFSHLFSKAECKIGNRIYPIWKDSTV